MFEVNFKQVIACSAISFFNFIILLIISTYLRFSLLEHILNLVTVKGSVMISEPMLINFGGTASTPTAFLTSISFKSYLTSRVLMTVWKNLGTYYASIFRPVLGHFLPCKHRIINFVEIQESPMDDLAKNLKKSCCCFFPRNPYRRFSQTNSFESILSCNFMQKITKALCIDFS